MASTCQHELSRRCISFLLVNAWASMSRGHRPARSDDLLLCGERCKVLFSLGNSKKVVYQVATAVLPLRKCKHLSPRVGRIANRFRLVCRCTRHQTRKKGSRYPKRQL